MNSATPVSSPRNYPLLLVSQFLGAFGDNAVLAVLVGRLTWLNRDGLISSTELATRSAILTSLLFVPYICLAHVVGWANDRFPKTACLTYGNLIKIIGTLVCIFAGASYPVQCLGYLVVGIGSALYGPGKYGILPEIVDRDKLVKANGLVELLTLLAILLGAVGGSILADEFHAPALGETASSIPLWIVAGLFGAAFALNACMVRTPCQPGLRLRDSVHGFIAHLKVLFRCARMGSVLIGTALFWVCGAAMKMNFQPWGLKVIGFDNNTATSLLAVWLAIGTMVGSILAGKFYLVGDLRHTRRYGFTLAVMVALLVSVAYVPAWLSPAWSLMIRASPFRLFSISPPRASSQAFSSYRSTPPSSPKARPRPSAKPSPCRTSATTSACSWPAPWCWAPTSSARPFRAVWTRPPSPRATAPPSGSFSASSSPPPSCR